MTSSGPSDSTKPRIFFKIPNPWFPGRAVSPTAAAEPATRVDSPIADLEVPFSARKQDTTEATPPQFAAQSAATPNTNQDISLRPPLSTAQASKRPKRSNANTSTSSPTKRPLDDPQPSGSTKKRIAIMADAESRNKLTEYEVEIQNLKTEKIAVDRTIVQLTAEIADMKKAYEDLERRTTEEYEELSKISEGYEAELNNRDSEFDHAKGFIAKLEAQVLALQKQIAEHDMDLELDALPEAPEQVNSALHVSFEGHGIKQNSQGLDPIDFEMSLSNLRPDTLPEGAVTPGPQQAPQQANPAPHISFEGNGIKPNSEGLDPIDFKKSLSNLRPNTLPEGAVTPGPQQAPQQANPAPHVSFEGKGIEGTSQEIDPIDFKKSFSNLRPHTLPEAVVTPGPQQAPEQANPVLKPEANTGAVAPLPARLESHQLPQETVRPSWPPTAPFKFNAPFIFPTLAPSKLANRKFSRPPPPREI